jgi:hypothetical protein
MQEWIKSRWNKRNGCYHSVWPSTLKNIKTRVHKTASIILTVVLCGCETWSLALRDVGWKFISYYNQLCCDIVHLPQQCHNSKPVIFQEKLLEVLKCYNFLWVQRRHNCSPASSFANCVMTLYLLKVHLQTFSFYINNSKMPKFWVVTLLSQMSDIYFYDTNFLKATGCVHQKV